MLKRSSQVLKSVSKTKLEYRTMLFVSDSLVRFTVIKRNKPMQWKMLAVAWNKVRINVITSMFRNKETRSLLIPYAL